MRKRNVEFHFMLTPDEAEQLRSKAAKCGLSVQAYLRALVKNRPIKEQPQIEFFDIMDSLERIGGNINQIAAKANAIGFIDVKKYEENYDNLQRVVAKLLRAVYS